MWLDCTEPSLCTVYSVTANLREPQHHRDSKVWRGLSQEFGVVRLYRTFSSYLLAGETRCAGCCCTSSGWFKHSEPHRTYTNLFITERARYVEVSHRRSVWFDCTEPSLCTLLQGKQGVQGALGTVEPPRTHVINLYTPCSLCDAVVRVGSMRFDVLEPPRTSA